MSLEKGIFSVLVVLVAIKALGVAVAVMLVWAVAGVGVEAIAGGLFFTPFTSKAKTPILARINTRTTATIIRLVLTGRLGGGGGGNEIW
jgi:hypothetical protein